MPDSVVAQSPAQTGDGKPARADEKSGSGNLTQGQAAARLFAAQAETTQSKATQTATEETAPGKPEETNAPVAEAANTAVAAEDDDIAEAKADEAAKTAETTAEPEAESEAEADSEVPSHSTSAFTPEQQKIFDERVKKRLGKEAAKREAIEAKLAAAEAKLAAAEAGGRATPGDAAQAAAPVQPAPLTGPQPLAQYEDLASLGKLQSQAKEAVRWAEQILDTPRAWKTKTDTDPDTGEETSYRVTTIGDQTYTEQGVKGIMRQAKLTLEDHIPARAQFVSAKQQATQAAIQEFPFLADKSSAEYQQAQAMLRDPWLQQRPDALWIVGVQIEGMKAHEARKTKTVADTKPKPKTTVSRPSNDQAAVSSATTTTRVPVQTGVRQAMAAEEAKLRSKGGITTAEAAASLQARERFRNSR